MNKIRELRKEKGLTLKELSDELDKKDVLKVASDTLGKYERGLREPKLKTWQALANFFNVPVAYLQGVSNVKDWTPEKGDELLRKSNIKEFNIKYKNDEKLLKNIPDEMKPMINNFDDSISLLKSILLSSENKSNNVISANTTLMFMLSDVINDISQNLISAYYPSKDNKSSEIDDFKMLSMSVGYAKILKDTVKKIDDYNSKNEKDKMISMLNSLGINVDDLINNKEKSNNTSDETTDKD